MSISSAAELIRLLDLRPHPEGGAFVETFRDPEPAGTRGHSTAIYYLLQAGEVSRWHRIDAVEVWHYYAGAPIELMLSDTRKESARTAAETRRLGTDLAAGERPQIVVPAGWWQTARSLGQWTLVGCTVAPGFLYESFELAPEGWKPEEAAGDQR
jgi:uncharacterized protein